MNYTVSMEGIGNQTITFCFDREPTPGYPCAMLSNNRICDATADTAFIGVTQRNYNGYASIQTAGYVELPYTGTVPALGWATLVSAGDGAVKTAETGTRCLVVMVDKKSSKVGLFL